MNSQVYSSEYLRNLPTKLRNDYVRQFILQFEKPVIDAASKGNTSVFISYDPAGPWTNAAGVRIQTSPNNPLPTVEECLGCMAGKFQDCRITYEEKQIDVTPDKQELRKGFTVDWSA